VSDQKARAIDDQNFDADLRPCNLGGDGVCTPEFMKLEEDH
jgi:hypothetical protein